MTAPDDAVRYPTLTELIGIAAVATGGEPAVRDVGLLESALHRAQATVFGEDAYPTIFGKAAALTESLIRNHALVDGNKRTAWVACVTFLEANGRRIEAPDDEAYELVIRVAEGRVELDQIASALETWSVPT